ncbi:MAG: PQQ-binding-like beta-propeller repeat protein [Actinobacteria bacterium]|nr:PQQ-binding-like beta-propeller repeat protein [Actinomycetota bacterium]
MADTCAACGATSDAAGARWCGHCGARLAATGARPTRRAPTGSRDPALVTVGSTALLVDDPPREGEVVPSAPAWSPRARLVAAAGVLLVLVAVLVARPDPEVTYEARGFTARGDASRSGVVSLAPLDVPTTVAWSADVGAARTSSRVRAAGDLVLEQTGGGILAARDAATGTVRWLRRDLAAPGPAVRVGDVVVVSDGGSLRGLSATDGTERWQLGLVDATELVPSGGDVVVRGSGRMLAVGAATGEVRWELDEAAVLDATVRAAVPGGAGLGLWVTSPAGLAVDSPRVTHRIMLLDPATGDVRWTDTLRVPFLSPPVAVSARHVAWTDAGAITVATPEGRVVHRLPGRGGPALAATGDLLAVARWDGGIVGIDLRTGADRWTRPDLTTDQMVATDGLVVTADGTLVDAVTGRTLSGQRRLTLDVIAGETSVLALPAIAGTELEIRDRRGRTMATAPLVPDEAAAPAVGAGRVFVPTRDGVEAFAVGDGQRDWSFAQLPTSAGLGGGQATARTPAVADTTVLVSPGTGFGGGPGLVALELTGGVRTWDREGDAPIVRGPLTLAGNVAFVPVGGEIHAYDAATGRRAFAAVAGTKRGPLVVGPNRVIGGPQTPADGRGDGEAVAILRRDRSENWRVPLVPCSGPVLTGDRVAWGTATGVTALDELTGEVAWRLETERPVCLDPVAVGGRLVVVEDPATVLALPTATGGTPLWSTELPSPPVASPVVAGRQLLVPLLDGTVAAYHLEDGTPAWTFDLGGVADASPAVLDDRILVHLRDGRLVALAP